MKVSSNPKSPSVTVVVPTRDRADTLFHTLRNICHEGYPQLAILVSDNFSSDSTASVVKSIDDPRISYINPGRRLSMSHHWEFVLGHIASDYVMFVGDDDGVVPGGVARAAMLLRHYGLPDAITCSECTYYWEDDGATFNDTDLPGRSIRFKLSDKVRWMDSRQMLLEFGAQRAFWHNLPCIYRGFVSTAAIRRATRNGVFFRSLNPDLYSSVAIAAVTDRYLFSEQPFSIAGVSRHSIGFSSQSGTASSAGSLFWAEGNIPWHMRLPKCLLSPFFKVEAILQAIEAGLLPADHPLDFVSLIRAATQELANMPEGRRVHFRADLEAAALELHVPLQHYSSSKQAEVNRLQPTIPASYYWRTGHISGICPEVAGTVEGAATFLQKYLRKRRLLLAITDLWGLASRVTHRLLGHSPSTS